MIDELKAFEDAKLLRSVAIQLLPTEAAYKTFRVKLHPDRFQPDNAMVARATVVFQKIEQLWQLAQSPAVILQGKNSSYELGDLIGTGDIAEVYKATCSEKPVKSGAPSDECIVKMPRVSGAEALLELENKRLKSLAAASVNTSYGNYVPIVAETLKLQGHKGKTATVFFRPFNGIGYSLEDVKTKHTSGLDGRHVCWIFRRLLTAIGFAHKQGIVHGAVLPQHILVEPKSHGLQLCGWIHSVEFGKLISIVPQSHRDLYPDEVLKKKYAGPETDIFMAAKTMLAIANNDLPKRLAMFFKSMLLDSPSMRPADAFALEEEFVVFMDSVYGKRQFVSLEM